VRSAGHAGRLLQRKCACGTPLASASGECTECKKGKLQKKLAIGRIDDPLERQADEMAAQVMAGGAHERPIAAARQISRAAADGGAAETASPRVDRVLGSGGQALDAPTRRFMEAQFGHDFGHVRVHSGAEADASARDVSALAYTAGSDIVFARGRYQPHTADGRRLLAHELAHVLQQSDGVIRRVPDKATVKEFDDRLKAIKKRPEYKKLKWEAKQEIEEIAADVRKRDNVLYYATKLELLFDTAEQADEEQAADTSKDIQSAAAKEATRLGTDTGTVRAGIEEAASKDPTRIFKKKTAPDGTIFQIDARDVSNIAVKAKVRLKRAGKGKADDVTNVESLVDSIEKHASTLGYSVDLEFVKKGGPDVFTVEVDTAGWTTAGNWAGEGEGLAHELHHLLGLDDRYDYIESHANNPQMKRDDRVHWFREELRKTIDNNALSLMGGPGTSPLDDDVCMVAGKTKKADLAACVQARKSSRELMLEPARILASNWAMKATHTLSNIGPGDPRAREGEPTTGQLRQALAVSKAQMILDTEVAPQSLSSTVGDVQMAITRDNLLPTSELTPGCDTWAAVASPSRPQFRLCPAFMPLSTRDQASQLLRVAFNTRGIGAASDAACTKPGCEDGCGGGVQNGAAWARLTQCVAEL
jgi:hypothetical protein